MKLKSREALGESFKQGKLPSETHFKELIASTLNRRDDQFHGVWQPGVTYRVGDIVIYQRAIWELVDDGLGCRHELCSNDPPGPGNWRLFVLPVADDDWVLTDLPGAESQPDGETPEPATLHANPRVVAVGIGTETPTAVLDVLEPDRGRLLFNGCVRPGATLRLEGPDHHYLAASIDGEAALISDAPEGFAFYVGPEQGVFCAQAGVETCPPLVAVKADGRVGIGTDSPEARLEITNGTSGRFLFNLDRRPNPALSVVNLRPGCREQYLACGVDNDVAALVTDAEYGFLFRAGGECGTRDHEVDINQGRELVSILPHGKGKLGIGRQPADYQLDLDGLARAYGVFIDTDESRLASVEPLCSVLDRVMALRPVSFRWGEGVVPDDPQRRIGLVAHEVDDVFPETVRTNRDRTKAVAYEALVPVLIKALQEQKGEIDRLEGRLAELERQTTHHKTPPESAC